MNNRPAKNNVAANMDEMIFRAFHGHATDDETRFLESWRAARDENEREYAELQQILGDTLRLAPELAAPPPPVEELTLEEIPVAPRRIADRNSSRRRRVVAFAIAASIALFFGATRVLPSLSGEMLLGSGEIVTGAGEMTSVRLADGSIVRLAPSSRLRIAGKKGTREVWLDGRAYFAVAKHPRAPFRVRTKAGDALVLGTRFDLQARDENLKLLVVEGAVNVASRGESLEVAATQSASVSPELGPVVASVDDDFVREELSWLGDFLVFEDTPLSQVARELSAHFDVRVEVLDSVLAKQTVRGMFVEEKLESVVKQICQALSASCLVSETGVTIRH